MAKIIHTMLRVLDEERSVKLYKSAFDLDVAKRLDFDNFTLVYLRNDENDFEVELTINKGQETAYNLGNGYGHFAVVVDDLESEHRRFETSGFTPRKIVEFERDGALFAKFFFVKDPDGYEIEMMQRHGRYT